MENQGIIYKIKPTFFINNILNYVKFNIKQTKEHI